VPFNSQRKYFMLLLSGKLPLHYQDSGGGQSPARRISL